MTDILAPVGDGMPTVPHLAWEDFAARFDWRQGEHVALIGPTGSGKTTLALSILPRRGYVAVMATKPKDSTLKQFAARHGFRVMQAWDDRGFWRGRGRVSPVKVPRRIIWPNALDPEMSKVVARQQKTFYQAINAMFHEGSWCIYIDELWWFGTMLKMDQAVKMLLQQGRSLGISLVVATQRPAFIPLEVYDQSTHLFFWRDNDERNLARISGVSSEHSAETVRNAVAGLKPHQVLYVNTRTNALVTTMSPPPNGKAS